MTLNPATVGHNAYDLLDGSVSSFYADVDEAIAASEVVKGQYRYTINPAYNSPNPVDSTAYTTIGLTQSGPMVVDLENSFITSEVSITANLVAKNAGIPANTHWFLGWKSSIEAIERYEILVNSTPIYTQSFCAEESFIQYQTLSDLVAHTTPYVYTTYENVKKLSPNVCGAYIKFPSDVTAGLTTKIEAKIPIKIPITNFIPLRTLKYLMSWMGKWELRLYFTEKNMIVYPFRKDETKAIFGSGPVDTAVDAADAYSFVNFEEDFLTPGDTKNAATITMRKDKMTFSNVAINTAQFQIRMDVLEMLKQKYMQEKPLTFPVSTFQISRFTGITSGVIPKKSTQSFNIVLCQAINNCDTLFILPFSSSAQRTCITNPLCTELQLQAGEYGTYPNIPLNTYLTSDKDTIRFTNYVMDALNVNSSPLTSMNRSVCRTFMPYTLVQNAVGGGEKATAIKYDHSNFFIPMPFSTDDDFQGGLSSPASNINFKLTGILHNDTDTESKPYSVPWVAAFLVDSVIMIRPDPASDSAKVIWSDRTVC